MTKWIIIAVLAGCLGSLANAQTGAYGAFGPDSSLAVVREELQIIRKTLAGDLPVRLLENVDPERSFAQAIALQDPRSTQLWMEPNFNQAVRTEVFGVEPLRLSDLSPQQREACSSNNCFRVELFNYVANLSTMVIVDTRSSRVLGVNQYKNTQPDIPERLRQLAIRIATQSPEVHAALGYQPSDAEALMASTKTALNRSRCERSQHLCVAPTFIKGDKAIWAIVDLTDLRLVGIRWTNVGDPGELPKEIITERKLQNGKITEQFCQTINHLDRNGWDMNYILTSSDGLRVSEVNFGGKPVLESAKLVDWHVSYSNTDNFGYSDAVGCPCFSTAAVIAIDPPQILTMVEDGRDIGFALQQNFYSEGWPLACNYNYCQRYEFYSDGRFRVTVASLGRGCGNNGTYRPVTRIVFAEGAQQFAEWDGKSWKSWQQEQWSLQTPLTSYTPEGYQYRMQTAGGAYFVEPGQGQFDDGGRGDNAYVFITKHDSTRDEGDSDLPTIGPCCNTDYRQGPEKFIEPTPETLDNGRLVFWYVSQIRNDDTPGKEYCWAYNTIENGVYAPKTFPCFTGPMFVPAQ